MESRDYFLEIMSNKVFDMMANCINNSVYYITFKIVGFKGVFKYNLLRFFISPLSMTLIYINFNVYFYHLNLRILSINYE